MPQVKWVLFTVVSPLSFSSPSEVFFGRDGGRIGGQYNKVLYREYTDDTFSVTAPVPEHLGILGKEFLFSPGSWFGKHPTLFYFIHCYRGALSLTQGLCLCLSVTFVWIQWSSLFIQVRSWGQRKETLSKWHSWTRLIGTTVSSLMACTMTNRPREAAMRTVREQLQQILHNLWYILIVTYQWILKH